ncbi:uncharacterized protein LOC119300625 isoform X1 [Triticum dicoccoides]|uniref:uncharacterized protein LOC119300625 isoform X1 n=1 Tax=Triticum dicoccoides TaxID=85692 RepID=UPI00188E3D9A|nr:uncharacterized protein LOC119300625 isoform X1 [Triticum dicoccoides]
MPPTPVSHPTERRALATQHRPPPHQAPPHQAPPRFWERPPPRCREGGRSGAGLTVAKSGSPPPTPTRRPRRRPPPPRLFLHRGAPRGQPPLHSRKRWSKAGVLPTDAVSSPWPTTSSKPRNLLWATSKHDVYVMQNYSVRHWWSLLQRGKELLNVACPNQDMQGGRPLCRVKISTMTVKDNLLAAGGFHWEQICNARGNDYHSRVSGLGAREEEQLLLDQAVRQQHQGAVQQGAQQPLQCPLLQVLGLGEQQDRGGPAISGRGQGCCPIHDQDQEAEHPCQAPAQDSDAQGVPQDDQVCQEPSINSRVLYLNCPYAWLLSYNYAGVSCFVASIKTKKSEEA